MCFARGILAEVRSRQRGVRLVEEAQYAELTVYNRVLMYAHTEDDGYSKYSP